MARTDNLKNYLADVGAAIKEKRKISSTINGANYDTEIRKIETGTSFDANSKKIYTVKQDEQIKTGDFVKFYVQENQETYEDKITKFSLEGIEGSVLEAVQISTNKFLIASTKDSNRELYITYLNISQPSKYIFKHLLIKQTNNYIDTKCIRMIKISESKILLGYVEDNYTTFYIGFINVSNEEISYSSETIISTKVNSATIDIFKLTNTMYFTVYGEYVRLIEINNDSITLKTEEFLFDTDYGTTEAPYTIIQIASNVLCIASRTGGDSNSYLLAFRTIVINFDTLEMTDKGYVDIRTGGNYNFNAKHYSIVPLSNTMFFIASSYGTQYSDDRLLGRLISLSYDFNQQKTVLQILSSIIISSKVYTGTSISRPLINMGGLVFLLHSITTSVNEAMEGIILNPLTEKIIAQFSINANYPLSKWGTPYYYTIIPNGNNYVFFGELSGFILNISNIVFVEKITSIGDDIIGLALLVPNI